MGASRKVFGAEVVARHLVPHRADIGVAAFGTIGVAACTQLGLIDSGWAAGGAMHLVAAALAQLGYLCSLVARNDLFSMRLVLLVLVWLGLATGLSTIQIPVEVASLWIVKLRLTQDPTTQSGRDEARNTESAHAPFIRTRPKASKTK